MNNIDQLCLSTTVFGPETPELSLEEMIQRVATAGYKFVELSRKQHDLAGRSRFINEAGLRVWSIHGTLADTAASPEEPLRRAAVMEEFKRMDDVAAFAPCPYVIHYVDRYLNPDYGRSFRKSVSELYQHASPLGLVLAIETAPYKPLQNERYPDSAEIAALVRSFAAPDLGMTIDINHSNINEKLSVVCDNCNGLIANVHISDNYGEWEDHLPPGQGVIPLAETFAALRHNGYAGPCNLEFHAQSAPYAEFLRNIKKDVERQLGWL